MMWEQDVEDGSRVRVGRMGEARISVGVVRRGEVGKVRVWRVAWSCVRGELKEQKGGLHSKVSDYGSFSPPSATVRPVTSLQDAPQWSSEGVWEGDLPEAGRRLKGRGVK